MKKAQLTECKFVGCAFYFTKKCTKNNSENILVITKKLCDLSENTFVICRYCNMNCAII